MIVLRDGPSPSGPDSTGSTHPGLRAAFELHPDRLARAAHRHLRSGLDEPPAPLQRRADWNRGRRDASTSSAAARAGRRLLSRDRVQVDLRSRPSPRPGPARRRGRAALSRRCRWTAPQRLAGRRVPGSEASTAMSTGLRHRLQEIDAARPDARSAPPIAARARPHPCPRGHAQYLFELDGNGIGAGSPVPRRRAAGLRT